MIWLLDLGRPENLTAFVMDHVFRVVRDPDLRFPSDVRDVLLEFLEIRKRGYVDAGGRRRGRPRFKLHVPLWRYWSVGSYRLHEEEPIPRLVVQDHIRQFPMTRDRDAELLKEDRIDVQRSLRSVAEVKKHCVRLEARRELLHDRRLQYVVLAVRQ